MNTQTTALVALDAHVDRGVVETLVTSSPLLDVSDYVDLTAHHSARGDVDVLIVACAGFTSAVGDYIGAASRLHPGRPVVLVSGTAGNGYVGEAMGAGADDILTLPPYADLQTAHALSEQLAFTIEKA